MVVTSIDSKKRGDGYRNVKKIIDYSIAVSPWMTEDSLKCAVIIHKKKRIDNKLIDKEEAETDKSEHQNISLRYYFHYYRQWWETKRIGT